MQYNPQLLDAADPHDATADTSNNKAMKHMHVFGHAEKIHNCYIMQL